MRCAPKQPAPRRRCTHRPGTAPIEPFRCFKALVLADAAPARRPAGDAENYAAHAGQQLQLKLDKFHREGMLGTKTMWLIQPEYAHVPARVRRGASRLTPAPHSPCRATAASCAAR